MHTQLELELADRIRSLLRQGMILEGATLQNISQVLGTSDANQLATRLSDPEDAEAWSMRDLVLFPDQPLAMAVEAWLLKHEQRSGQAIRPDLDALAMELTRPEGGVHLRLCLPEQTALWLLLDHGEARRLAARLHLNKTLPSGVHELLAAPVDPARQELLLALRLACRQARLPWTPAQETFVLALLHGSLPGQNPEMALRRPLDVTRWALAFLEHAGDDVPAAMSRRRETLLQHLDQAREMDRVREAYNFETRRMLGIAEQHFAPAAIRDELELIELAARATGGYAPLQQTMRRNLGDIHSVEQAAGMLE